MGNRFFYWLSLFCLSLLLSSCASIKKWWEGDEKDAPMAAAPPPPPTNDTVRFSENPNVGTFNDRRYRRATRKSLEEESEVGSRAGSLWNTEGPSAYLFTQNKLHREGDLLNVKIEGNAKSQMETKIGVIKKLLARLEIINNTESSPLASSSGTKNSEGSVRNELSGGSKEDKSSLTNRDPASMNSPKASGTLSNPPNSSPNATANPEATSEIEAPINIDSIPTRVAERMGDGNYRVKGQQSFLIGKKEFRVIVTGLVRPEDFSDEGISSNKLLDPQLDIVSLRRNIQ